MKAGLVNYLVAGSGLGKSILATQIARAVDKGICPEFLPPTCSESVKLDVVYYRLEDFEGELDGKYGEGKVLRHVLTLLRRFLVGPMQSSSLVSKKLRR